MAARHTEQIARRHQQASARLFLKSNQLEPAMAHPVAVALALAKCAMARQIAVAIGNHASQVARVMRVTLVQHPRVNPGIRQSIALAAIA